MQNECIADDMKWLCKYILDPYRVFDVFTYKGLLHAYISICI